VSGPWTDRRNWREWRAPVPALAGNVNVIPPGDPWEKLALVMVLALVGVTALGLWLDWWPR
jgi:hypothetical protein